MKSPIGVIGANGRMGQEIMSLLAHHGNFSPAVGFVESGTAVGFERTGKANEKADYKGLKAVIDFSDPEACLTAARIAANLKIPFLSGTTGLSKNQIEELKDLGKGSPFFWSPNMSLGIAMMIRALKAIRPNETYDLAIEETHHRNKKDSPSGTALLIQRQIETAWERSIDKPTSFRGGGDFGTHIVKIMGSSETLTFQHQALNRKVFAEGALTVLPWILKKTSGFYQFDDFFEQK